MKSVIHRNYTHSDYIAPEETWLYRICLWLVAIGALVVIFWD